MRPAVRLPSLAATIALVLLASTAAVGQDAKADSAKKDKKPLPLETTRTIKISTDEGTWISVDVSPDGKTVLFDLLGDLYTVPITGGTATPLTSGIAFDGQPRYSPDGTKVLFVSDRSGGDNLWTLDLASKDTAQVTKGNGNFWMSPDWTPDGKYVVASKGETRLGAVRLWMGHVDGGSGVQLHKEPPNLKTVGAAVSPDGRHVWYARRTNSWDYNARLPQYQLGVYDRETGQDYARTSRYGSAFRPTLSADGRWLAYGTRHEDQTGLRLRDLSTGDERWLAYPVQRDEQESIADRDVLPGMAFAPDSKELVASYGGKIWRIPVDGSAPIAVPFTVEAELAIGPKLAFDYVIGDSAQFTVRQIRDADPSPDGRRLAFVALDRLYVMDYPGGQPRRVTAANTIEAHPDWSPDGQWIAYVTWTPQGGHLMKVRADGRGAPLQLTRVPATYQQPTWSPKGDRIALVRGPARAYQEATGPIAPGAADDLAWVPAAGGAVTAIAPTDGRSSPHFTRDPERIWLHHNQKGLLSIRWDGSDEKEHLKVVGNKRPGQQNPNAASLTLMAPAGDWAVAQVNHDLYAVTVPWVGGETPTVSVADPSSTAFPVRKLTVVGGQFPAWSASGRRIHWSIGNAHFVYDLDRAKAFEDSVAAAKKAEAAAKKARADSLKAAGADTAKAATPDSAKADSAKAAEKKEKGYEPAEHRVIVRAARDIPRGTVVLRGARVVTMVGDEVIADADLVVRDARIVGVGARGQVPFPSDARVMDVAGSTIVPGFVDTHAHMRPSWGIHKSQAWTYLANLAYGVTTTRDPQTSSTDVITYGDLVEAGQMVGPRIYSTGPGVFGDYVEDPLKDLDHARSVLKRYSEYYDTKTIKMYMAGNRQQRQWVIMAAKEQGLMPTTEGGLMMKYDMTLMLDGYPGLEHSLPVYPIYKDVAVLTAESGIAYTPTLLVSYGGPFSENYFFAKENPHGDAKLRRFTPHSDLDARTRRRNDGWFMDEEYVFEEHGRGLKQVVDAGGRVGVGSHGQLQGLGYHWELWAMAAGGLTPLQALRAATLHGAEAIGLAKELGSIEAGKLADLVVLRGNPLESLRNTNTVRYVMKQGRLYDGDTLDEVWPRTRPLERVDWEVPEPETAAGIR